MSGSCITCTEDLPGDGDYLLCSYCKGGLHWICGGLKESSWRSMSNPTKANWKCPVCRAPKRQGNLTQESGDEQLTMANIRKTLDKMFGELRGSMETRFTEIENSLEFNGKMLEDLQKSFKETQQKIIVMEKTQDKLEKQNQELQKKIKNLECFVQDTVQEGNKCKIEISGIPQYIDYKSFTAQVFEKIKVNNFVKQDEYTIEKTIIKKKDNEPQVKSLVLTLKNEETRDKVLETIRINKPTLKSEEFSSQHPSTVIYINEYLSPYMKKLLYEVKALKKDKNFSYVWVRNGKIFVKVTEGANPIRLRSLDDLSKI